MSSDYFKRGKFRKITPEESKKYKKQFDIMRNDCNDFMNGFSLLEYYEENNSEGNDRLILASRDDQNNLGVMIGMNIKTH